MKYNLRNIIAYFFANAFILLGRVRRARNKALKGDYMLSIYFHNPSKKEFTFAVRWLRKNGFSFISIDDLKEILRGQKPFPKGAVLITVDDGWASNVPNMVEVANRERIPIAIFISTEAIEKGNYWFNYAKKARKGGLGFPSVEEIKRLPNQERLSILSVITSQLSLPRAAMTIKDIKTIHASGWVTIGGHSHSHPVLIRCTEEELIHEITYSKIKIENWVQKKVDIFAYPNGDFGEREINALKSAGYALGFANNPDYLTPLSLVEPYRIPRAGFLEGASRAENICRMTGVWKNFKKIKRI